MPAAVKPEFLSGRAAGSIIQPDIDQPYRLGLGPATRSGNASDAESYRYVSAFAYARSHRSCNLPAHRAMPVNQRFRHSQHLRLRPIAIADSATIHIGR